VIGDDKPPRRAWRRLTEEERRLWSAVARSIAPLKRAVRPDVVADSPDRERHPPPAPRRRAETIATPRPASKSAPKPAPKPPLAPIERRLKQRLARGSEGIDARLDLHGRTQSEAHGALLHFLRRAQADGAKVVLVITGKGGFGGHDRSHERGVLKRQVPFWLKLPEFRPYVLGIDDAHVGHGGEGALYVRVRRARRD
jgi:DNA-nicking Smr family endonuclease